MSVLEGCVRWGQFIVMLGEDRNRHFDRMMSRSRTVGWSGAKLVAAHPEQCVGWESESASEFTSSDWLRVKVLADGRPATEVQQEIRAAMRMIPDTVAVRNLPRSLVGDIVHAATTGHGVVCSMDAATVEDVLLLSCSVYGWAEEDLGFHVVDWRAWVEVVGSPQMAALCLDAGLSFAEIRQMRGDGCLPDVEALRMLVALRGIRP